MFFCFFLLFPSATKIPDNRSRERLNGFSWNFLPNDSGVNGVCIAVPKWGLGPRLIFWRLKTTHCALGGDAWRMTQKITLCWSADYGTVQLRRLRYKCMKEWMHLIWFIDWPNYRPTRHSLAEEKSRLSISS